MNDKLKHFFVGFGISAIIVLVANSLVLAGMAVLVVAVGKEVWDYYHPEKHQAEWLDIAATMAGWLPVAFLFLTLGR